MSYNVPLSNELLYQPGHINKMGQSVWTYLWFLDRITAEHETETGKIGIVLYKKIISPDQIASELNSQFSTRQIKRHIAVLKKHGYISSFRTKKGCWYIVNNSTKFSQRDISVPEKGQFCPSKRDNYVPSSYNNITKVHTVTNSINDIIKSYSLNTKESTDLLTTRPETMQQFRTRFKKEFQEEISSDVLDLIFNGYTPHRKQWTLYYNQPWHTLVFLAFRRLVSIRDKTRVVNPVGHLMKGLFGRVGKSSTPSEPYFLLPTAEEEAAGAWGKTKY